MKRRVQRAHSNKRTLRIVSATHKLSLDNYNILLDASFMRACVMAFMQEEGRLRLEHGMDRDDPPPQQQQQQQQHRFNAQVNPFAYIKDLVEESFGINSNDSAKEEDYTMMQQRQATGRHGHHTDPNGSSAAPKKPKGVQLHFYYLPESAAALQRLIQHQQQEQNNKKKFKTSKIEEAVRYLLASLRKIHFQPDGAGPSTSAASASAASPLKGAQGKGKKEGASRSSASPPSLPVRNEAKTIAAFLRFAALPPAQQQQQQQQQEKEKEKSGEQEAGQPAAPTGMHVYTALSLSQPAHPTKGGATAATAVNTFQMFKNAHHFFVATQSHDTRRQLPGDAALLRLSLKPNCIYMEIRGQSFHYPDDHQAAGSARGAGAASSGSAQNAGAQPVFKRTRSSGSVPPHATKRGRTEGTASSPSLGAIVSLAKPRPVSEADAAFMRHLGMRESAIPAVKQPLAAAAPAAPTKRSPKATTSSSPQASSGAPSSGETREGPKHAGGRKAGGPVKGKKKVSNPNPLSNKKKQKREVFRI